MPSTDPNALPAFPLSKAPEWREKGLHILIKAIEQSPVSVIITNTKGIIEYVNPKFTQLMGYTAEEAVGKTPRIIKGGFLSREFYRDMWATILAGKEWHGVFHNRTKDGALVWEVASISPIRDADGTVTHFVGVKEDITEIRRLQEQLEHMAQHDQLTGLPNRFLLNDRLQQALLLAKRRRSRFAVLYLDLDGFKLVNDTYGHEAGDAVLVEVAKRLLACTRESDTVARLGGDEFTVLMTEIQEEGNVERVASLIVKTLSEPIPLADKACEIGVSIGIALYPEDGETPDALLSRSDAALYRVKGQGRNGFQFAHTRPGEPTPPPPDSGRVC